MANSTGAAWSAAANHSKMSSSVTTSASYSVLIINDVCLEMGYGECSATAKRSCFRAQSSLQTQSSMAGSTSREQG